MAEFIGVLGGMFNVVEAMYKSPNVMRHVWLGAVTVAGGIHVARRCNAARHCEPICGSLPPTCHLGRPPPGFRAADPSVDGSLPREHQPWNTGNLADFVKEDTGARGLYFADCYDFRITQRQLLHQEFDNAEELLVRFAQGFLQSAGFRAEVWATSLLRGQPRPAWQLQTFQVGDKLGLWTVEYRTSREICLKWEMGGAAGRTWVGLETGTLGADADFDSAFFLRFGSAIWPYDASRWSARWVATPLHAMYSRLLLLQAGEKFIVTPPPAVARAEYLAANPHLKK